MWGHSMNSDLMPKRNLRGIKIFFMRMCSLFCLGISILLISVNTKYLNRQDWSDFCRGGMGKTIKNHATDDATLIIRAFYHCDLLAEYVYWSSVVLGFICGHVLVWTEGHFFYCCFCCAAENIAAVYFHLTSILQYNFFSGKLCRRN